MATASEARIKAMARHPTPEIVALLRSYGTFQRTYEHDPVGFVHDCIDWTKGERPLPYQDDALNMLESFKRVSVRGPHGLGKSAMGAWIVLWFALTRDGDDWKIPTTASVWRQLTKYLWPEIHKWSRRLRWGKIGRPPFNPRTELLVNQLKLSTGEAFAMASDQPTALEGAHADRMLCLFDEGKSIQDETYDAMEGALVGREAYGWASSTPGLTHGRFYDIHKRAAAYADWAVRHVTMAETIAAGRMTAEWQANRAIQWGEDSAIYQNRVLGEFSAADEAGVIPMAWIEAAILRWEAKYQARETTGAASLGRKMEKLTTIGTDVAYTGEDKTAHALREKMTIEELRVYAKQDTETTASQIVGIARARGGVAVIDVIGIGAGVVDKCRAEKVRVLAFNASAAAVRHGKRLTDRSGELEFVNLRSAAWWHVRELLDPAFGSTVALPPDDEIPHAAEWRLSLAGDLASPRWEERGGRIAVESKDEIKARLKRSPDLGDAVVQAFADELLASVVRGVPTAVGGRSSTWRNA